MARELFSSYCLNRTSGQWVLLCNDDGERKKNTVSGHGNYLVIRLV